MASKGSSLSAVVSDMVRNQSENAGSNGGTDLDAYVAQMLLKEAKTREARFGQEGVRVYFSDEEDKEGPAHRPSKRFLLSLVKNVDDHNQALLRQEQEEASQRKAERNEFMSEKERRQGSGGRLFAMARDTMGSTASRRPKEADKSENRSERRSSREKSSRRRSRDRSDDDRDREGRSSRHSRRPDQRRRLDYDREDFEDEHRHSRRDREERRHRDRSHSRSKRKRDEDDRETSSDYERRKSRRRSKRERTKSPETTQRSKDDRDGKSRQNTSLRKESEISRSREMSTASTSTAPQRPATVKPQIARVQPASRSPSLEPLNPPKSEKKSRKRPEAEISNGGPSKMDKYFAESYDPRLDVSVAELTDPYGFIGEGNFDEWSHMLEILKVRKEEKNYRAVEKEADRQRLKDERRDKEYAKKAAKLRKKMGLVDNSDSDDSLPAIKDDGMVQAAKMDSYAAVTGSALLGIGGYAKSRKKTEWRKGQPDMSF